MSKIFKALEAKASKNGERLALPKMNLAAAWLYCEVHSVRPVWAGQPISPAAPGRFTPQPRKGDIVTFPEGDFIVA